MMKILMNMNMTMILTIIYPKTTKIIVPEVDAVSWEGRGGEKQKKPEVHYGRAFFHYSQQRTTEFYIFVNISKGLFDTFKVR